MKVYREDFVALYVGKTAQKTKKLLESTPGKLYLDRRQLTMGDYDIFGKEALDIIEKYPDKVVFVNNI